MYIQSNFEMVNIINSVKTTPWSLWLWSIKCNTTGDKWTLLLTKTNELTSLWHSNPPQRGFSFPFFWKRIRQDISSQTLPNSRLGKRKWSSWAKAHGILCQFSETQGWGCEHCVCIPMWLCKPDLTRELLDSRGKTHLDSRANKHTVHDAHIKLNQGFGLLFIRWPQ